MTSPVFSTSPGQHGQQGGRQDRAVWLEQPVGVDHADLERRRPDRLDRRHAVDGEELVAFVDPADSAASLIACTTATPAMIEVRTGSCGPGRGEISEKTERPMASRAQIAAMLPVICRVRLVSIAIHRAGPRRQGAAPPEAGREASPTRGATTGRSDRATFARSVVQTGDDRIAGHSRSGAMLAVRAFQTQRGGMGAGTGQGPLRSGSPPVDRVRAAVRSCSRGCSV